MLTRLFALAALLLFPSLAGAESFTIEREASVFAIATQRAGIAGRMAHDHLVVAGDYEYELTGVGEGTDGIAFSLTVKAEDLVIDESTDLERWWPELRERGLVARDASSITENQRADVREAMLGEDQLNAENHPEIRAEVLSISENTDGDSTHTIRVAVTIVGNRVEYDFDADIHRDDEQLTVDAHTVAKFTDFGIRPYSAFLGAVRNQDEFVIFVAVSARK